MEQSPSGRRSVAYFSMEIGVDENICTYSGGLGVLAGDTIRSAADIQRRREDPDHLLRGEPVQGKGDDRDHSQDAPSLYDKLEHAIVSLFYHDRRRFMDMTAYSTDINVSFFNTQRMMQEYVLNAYFNR